MKTFAVGVKVGLRVSALTTNLMQVGCWWAIHKAKTQHQQRQEPDAYIFESLFQQQYKLSSAWYNSSTVTSIENSNQQSFTTAWNNFFNQGYSGSDYNNIYKYFNDGSKAGGSYGKSGPLNPSSGGYLIYQFLPKQWKFY